MLPQVKNQTTNTRVLICQGLEEEIAYLGSHGPTSSRLWSPVSAVNWAAVGLSHGGFEHLALCQPGCNPLLPSPVAVVSPVWRGEGNSISPYEMAEHLPLRVVSSHILELVAKDLPLQPGITFKPGSRAHKDGTTAGISNITYTTNYTMHLFHAPFRDTPAKLQQD